MDSESGARLFGFVGAGATLGQLFGSAFAAATAWMGPYLLLFAALLMEFAAESSKGIIKDISQSSEELCPLRKTDDDDHQNERRQEASSPRVASPRIAFPKVVSPKSPISTTKPELWAILDGMRLILASPYLLLVSLFLWLGAVISSFFYFQKVNIIATTIKTSIGRRKLFAQINSFVAVFILIGQLTLTPVSQLQYLHLHLLGIWLLLLYVQKQKSDKKAESSDSDSSDSEEEKAKKAHAKAASSSDDSSSEDVRALKLFILLSCKCCTVW